MKPTVKAVASITGSREKLHYRALVKAIPDIIMEVDCDRKYSWANEHGLAFFGKDVIGKPADYFFIGEQDVYRTVDPLFAGEEQVFQVESWQRRSDGEARLLAWSCHVLKDDRGAVLGALSTARDITERFHLLQMLTESEKKFRTLVETSRDGIWVIDQLNKTTYLNQAMADMLLYTVEEMMGTVFLEYVDPSDISRATGNVERRKAGVSEQHEFRFRRKDGSFIWTLIDTNPLINDLGEYTGAVAMVSDIQQRKEEEEMLKQREENYRELFMNSQVALYRSKIDGSRMLDVNRKLVEISGYSIEEILEKDIISWYADPQQRDAFVSLLQSQGVVENFITDFVHASGAVRTVTLTARIYPDKDYIEGSIVDITNIRLAELKLRASEEFNRQIVEAANEGIWAMNQKYETTYANRKMAEMLGYSIEEMMGKKVSYFMAPDELSDHATKMVDRKKGQPGNYERKFRRKDGKYIWTIVSSTPTLTPEGHFGGSFAMITDITGRVRADADRQALLEIMKGLVEADDLHSFLSLVHHAIARIIIAENFFVILYNGHTGLFEEVYSADKYDPPAPPSLLEKSISAHVFRSGEPILLTTEKHLELERAGLIEMIGTNSPSWMGVPLKTSGQTIGVMAVQDYERHDCYSERDLQFLASVAGQVAIMVEFKRSQEALAASEEKYKTVFNRASIGIALIDSNTGVIYEINPRFAAIAGRSMEEMINIDWMSITHPDDIQPDLDNMARMNSGETPGFQMEKRYIRPDGSWVWINMTIVPVKGEETMSHRHLCIIDDITERHSSNEIIMATLREKEVLLKEVHHRVKNNLQVVSSLLNLQAQRINDDTLKHVLLESKNRIRSIGLVHEKLYQSGNFAGINMRDYTKALIHELFRAYMTDNDRIDLKLDIGDIRMPLPYAMPCGLILNEIVSNSLKHAFTGHSDLNNRPMIMVTMKADNSGKIKIVAGDNGAGLPKGYALNDSSSLGLYLIHILATEQLDGHLRISSGNGTRFTISFNPF